MADITKQISMDRSIGIAEGMTQDALSDYSTHNPIAIDSYDRLSLTIAMGATSVTSPSYQITDPILSVIFESVYLPEDIPVAGEEMDEIVVEASKDDVTYYPVIELNRTAEGRLPTEGLNQLLVALTNPVRLDVGTYWRVKLTQAGAAAAARDDTIAFKQTVVRKRA